MSGGAGSNPLFVGMKGFGDALAGRTAQPAAPSQAPMPANMRQVGQTASQNYDANMARYARQLQMMQQAQSPTHQQAQFHPVWAGFQQGMSPFSAGMHYAPYITPFNAGATSDAADSRST